MKLADLARWTPVRLDFSGPAPAVDWADLTAERFVEPFFDQTVARWASGPRARPLVRTGLEALVALDGEQSLEPAGMIFHLSRCGSTLVSRLLGTLPGVVVAEPAPLNALLGLDPDRVDEAHAGPACAAPGAGARPPPARRRTAAGAQVHELEHPSPGDPRRRLSRNTLDLSPARPGARPGVAPRQTAGMARPAGRAPTRRTVFRP